MAGDVVTETVSGGEMPLTGLKTDSGPHSLARLQRKILNGGSYQR